MAGKLQPDLPGDLGEEAGGVAQLERGAVEVEQREGKAAAQRRAAGRISRSGWISPCRRRCEVVDLRHRARTHSP